MADSITTNELPTKEISTTELPTTEIPTKELDACYVAHTYNRFDLEIVGGYGSTVIDETGKEYTDLGSGIAVNIFGMCDAEWKAAIATQLDAFQHTSNLYYHRPGAKLAQMLCERTGMKRAFFNNSGAEANECAIKAARKYAAERKGADYYTIITLENSFHGRTLTTLAATGQDCFHELFCPLTPGFVQVPANDIAALDAALAANKVAGILVECIQGEGGVRALDADYVAHIAQVCAAQDIVFMVDEVQAGNGRSGKLFSYMNFDGGSVAGGAVAGDTAAGGIAAKDFDGGIRPDVVTTAKGLGGGLPIGATLLGEKLADVFGPGDNGSTFGANPVVCAGAINILSRLDDAMLAGVREKSAAVFAALEGAAGVESVSGMGLMIGVKTTRPAKEVIAECMEMGVLCLSAKDKVRLLPALNIPTEQLLDAIEILKEVCAR